MYAIRSYYADILGGNIPWPSVSRNDIDFHPDGMYWRGGVWLPTAYMATKALNRYGRYQTSSTLALHLLVHMQKTFEQNSPHTIWECYSPTKSEPAVVNTDNKQCRKDFCGWSALGPISMLIEDVVITSYSIHYTKLYDLKYPERIGDTTGCGDNFAGGFAASFIRQLSEDKSEKLSLMDAAAWAAASGGFACFTLGGTHIEKEPGEKYRILKRYYDASYNFV